MSRKSARRLLHLVLLVAVVLSALLGAFNVSAPFTRSAFADGYPGSGGTCCTFGRDCVGTNVACEDPVPPRRECSPTQTGYCKTY
jgi:hypothetical protein